MRKCGWGRSREQACGAHLSSDGLTVGAGSPWWSMGVLEGGIPRILAVGDQLGISGRPLARLEPSGAVRRARCVWAFAHDAQGVARMVIWGVQSAAAGAPWGRLCTGTDIFSVSGFPAKGARFGLAP